MYENNIALADEFMLTQQKQALIDEITNAGYVTLSVAAKEEGIPLSTLSQAVSQHRVPALRITGVKFVRCSAVPDYFRPKSQANIWHWLIAEGIITGPTEPKAAASDPITMPPGICLSEIAIQERR